MASQITKFLKELKGLSRAERTAAEDLVKSFKSDIKSLDEVVNGLTVSKNKYGFIELSENSVGKIHNILRKGDLKELIAVTGKKVPYTSAEAESFKSLVKSTPEAAYREITESVAANKKKYPQLNITTTDKGKMSSTAAKDVKRIEGNLIKNAKLGTTLALTLGSVYVGVDWLTKATEERKGCFMLTTIDNKTTSCKVKAYSCVGSGGVECTNVSNKYFNTVLVLIALSKQPDNNELKTSLCKELNVAVNEYNEQLTTIIDNKFSQATKFIQDNIDKIPEFNICDVKHPSIENGKVPPCRMCSPTDNPISTSYIDPSLYPDNVTFVCSANPTLLDTIVDASKAVGHDLFQGVSSGALFLLKPLLIIGIVLVILVVVVIIGMKLFKNYSEQQRNVIELNTTNVPYQRLSTS